MVWNATIGANGMTMDFVLATVGTNGLAMVFNGFHFITIGLTMDW